MQFSYQSWVEVPSLAIFGEDGEDEGEGAAGTSQEGEGNGDGEGKGNENEPKTFSLEAMQKLRKENADRRVTSKEVVDERDALQAKLDKIEQAEMGEVERLTAKLEASEKKVADSDAKSASDSAALKTERLNNAVVLAATEAKFHDPTDAISRLSQDDLIDEDGGVDVKKIDSEIKKLVKDKPYLVGSGSNTGSGDGAGNTKTGGPITHDERVAAHLEKMTTSGGRVAKK